MTVSNTDVYTNADGLKIRFGTAQAKTAAAGSPQPAGTYKTLIVDIDYSRIPAFGTTAVLDEITAAAIPAGAILYKSTFVVTTAFVGATGTLSIGLYKADGTTAITEVGIDDTIAVTAINAVGKAVENDGTYINGVALLYDSYISVLAGTASFTAGRGQLSINYFLPNG